MITTQVKSLTSADHIDPAICEMPCKIPQPRGFFAEGLGGVPMKTDPLFALIAVALCLAASPRSGSGQEVAVTREAPPSAAAILSKLHEPVYPPLAVQTRISGDVAVQLGIRQDGTLESAAVISGHPLLAVAALDSARQSEFACERCKSAITTYSMVYTFAIGTEVAPGACCTQGSPNAMASQRLVPRITRSENHITLVSGPVCICPGPPVNQAKVRSAKCLYLWKCAVPRHVAVM